jgi:hypothetical protein
VLISILIVIEIRKTVRALSVPTTARMLANSSSACWDRLVRVATQVTNRKSLARFTISKSQARGIAQKASELRSMSAALFKSHRVTARQLWRFRFAHGFAAIGRTILIGSLNDDQLAIPHSLRMNREQ